MVAQGVGIEEPGGRLGPIACYYACYNSITAKSSQLLC